MSEAVKIRLPDGREIYLEDWSDKPLFSTIEILAGATTQEMNLFQYTIGDNVPAFAPVGITAQRSATEMDTNMAVPGAMASSEEFMCYSIRPEVFQLNVTSAGSPNFATPAALANGAPMPTVQFLACMHLQLLLKLEISQKLYAEAGFGYFNFGGGVSGSSGQVDLRSMGSKGLPSNEAVRTYAIAQHIGGQEKFRVIIANPPGTALAINLGDGSETYGADTTRYARIRVYLDGLYKRPTA